ncbi:hypothetical protein J4457_00270 [Candidatus Woesearchaeota archaeon]|nr:hypothetical protein [Candidatus Woesearchaeota archaeon]
MVEREETYKYNDERILRGEVTQPEIGKLERALLRMYFKKAKYDVIILSDKREYDRLHSERASNTECAFYLLVTRNGIDPLYVVRHLMDTKGGLFYGKIVFMRQDKCRQP